MRFLSSHHHRTWTLGQTQSTSSDFDIERQIYNVVDDSITLSEDAFSRSQDYTSEHAVPHDLPSSSRECCRSSQDLERFSCIRRPKPLWHQSRMDAHQIRLSISSQRGSIKWYFVRLCPFPLACRRLIPSH
jgi:hypothetical protein